MASNRSIDIGPTPIPTTCGNLFSPSTGVTGGVNTPENIANAYVLIRHLRVTNRTNAAIVFGTFLSTTADATAGREIIWAATATGGPPATAITAGTGVSVPAQGNVEWFAGGPGLRISGADTNKFLTGIASATGLVIEGEAEIGFA